MVRSLPAEFQERESTLAPWDELRFGPEAVARAMQMLSRAFRVSVDDCLRLRTQDSLWRIYWGYYPSSGPGAPRWRRWLGRRPDELEMETLARDLAKAARARHIDLPLDMRIQDVVELLRS